MSANYCKETLLENLQLYGYEPAENVLLKCLELCVLYQINEEELVDHWQVYCIGISKNEAPTISGLELMERKELLKKKIKAATPVIEVQKTPKKAVNNKKSTLSEATSLASNSQDLNVSQSHDISAILESVQVEDYAKRSDAGKTMQTYGDNDNNRNAYVSCYKPARVKQYWNDNLSNDALFMYQTTGIQRTHLTDMTKHIAAQIAHNNNIILPAGGGRDVVYIYGRIGCTGGGKKLTETTIQLECVYGDYRQPYVPLLFDDNMESYSIFPGQVVVAHGKYIKQGFKVDQLFTSAYTTPPPLTQHMQIDENLQIITACGPFTIKNNLLFEPLQDLLKYVLEMKPHVLLLTGPFLDVEHDAIAIAMDRKLTDFQTFFDMAIESVMAPLQSTNIQVVLVASSHEAHHFNVYPTIPYNIKTKYANLLCVPDPCVLDLHGFIIGITSADILFNLGICELSIPRIGGDKIARLCKHVLSQVCFYPLYEVLKRKDSPKFDYGFLNKYGIMEVVPHLLILPSKFRNFIKKIDETIVINPETLVRNYASGTFARTNITTNNEIYSEIIRI